MYDYEEMSCETPGMRIRSGGRGRGLARGRGRGPVGIPYGSSRLPYGTGIGPGGAGICPTPGSRIRSGEYGRGFATGGGQGPMGVPYGRGPSSYMRSDVGLGASFPTLSRWQEYLRSSKI